jgi:carbamoyltransferase
MAMRFEEALGYRPPLERFEFVDHHMTHAASAFFQSGFDKSLVATVDGYGDYKSTAFYLAEGSKIELQGSIEANNSLGQVYHWVISVLGYGLHEEYKVMGLAPYGDPSVFREFFARAVPTGPDGTYNVDWPALEQLMLRVRPRRRSEPFTQEHKDVSAALQELLERVGTYVVEHYRRKTKSRNLCLAGGVAHNSSWMGKLLLSGQYEKLFVQPAAADCGGALGAALWAHHQRRPLKSQRVPHVYWGTDLGEAADIRSQLKRWEKLCDVEPCSDVVSRAADLLAQGEILGWAQGRAEFGPRALGNRSIVADPRPAKNKDVVNQMVKKREGYRPFAPSVLEEAAADYFEFPADVADLSFMTYVVKVREPFQQILGATTHVDGTARIQTVSKATNEKYWRLIDAFRQRTGVPVLLNTSFNNNAEPIVDNVDDAVVCYLTTALNHLVVGDFLVTRRQDWDEQVDQLRGRVSAHIRPRKTRTYDVNGQPHDVHELVNTWDERWARPISASGHALLERMDGKTTLGDLLSGVSERQAVRDELMELWSERLIGLLPA